MTLETIQGRICVRGHANGLLLRSDIPLSFWGGVNPENGTVIDQHHPLCGQHLGNRILAIPCGRGSSSGSGVLLELFRNQCAPAALIFCEPEEILTIGVVVAQQIFNIGIPVLQLSASQFASLSSGRSAMVRDQVLFISSSDNSGPLFNDEVQQPYSNDIAGGSSDETADEIGRSITGETTGETSGETSGETTGEMTGETTGSNAGGIAEYIGQDIGDESIHLSDRDRELLNDSNNKATQIAMQIVTRLAKIQGAHSLIDVTQAHIDACVYHGPAGLQFAQQLAAWGGRFQVPTTLNAISVEQRSWQASGVDAEYGQAACDLGNAYVAMGASPSFTCAPYLLESAPAAGEQIVWAESNAVVFANSVLGARTLKYGDFLEVCIALTGRAPAMGAHLDSGRYPQINIDVHAGGADTDLFWPLLGYHIGKLSGSRIPYIKGLEYSEPDVDKLKAFCAAFATTSSAAMVHIAGVTPEAKAAQTLLETHTETLATEELNSKDLLTTFHQLNSALECKDHVQTVHMVCLGNPHFSFSECATLANFCSGRQLSDQVKMIITLGKSIYESAYQAGYIKELEDFGAQLMMDTCWCMIQEPIVPDNCTVLMTNSAKYAHYGPGLINKTIVFDSLLHCVDAACTGEHRFVVPDWLSPGCKPMH
ncbi:MAG: DUF521 domain-containing protein [Granulosicoccus sp.]|nr:DUF521 domain-containing protein [Granulosicoccus sp.]